VTVVDYVGREVRPGCTIVYPVRRKSELKLKTMKEQQIAPNVSGFNADGRRVHVHNLENVIVVVPLGIQYE